MEADDEFPGGLADPGAYGRAFAEVYDDWYDDVSDVDATVGVLASMAAGQPVLELGVGTGRLAIPLAQHAPVTGVDGSPEMLARLAERPGAEAVRTHLGDMADLSDLPNQGPYAVVFIAFNTFFNLPDDDRQQRCIGEAARVLADAGRLVVEAFVPEHPPGDSGNRPVHRTEVRPDGRGGTIRTITTHEPAARLVHGVHVHTRADGTTVDRPWRIRYQYPAGLDGMATAAGLELEERWADWHRTPWGPDDPVHVSVYRRR